MYVCTGIQFLFFYFYLDLHSILDPSTQSDHSSYIDSMCTCLHICKHTPYMHIRIGRCMVEDTQFAIDRFAPIYSLAISRSNERAFFFSTNEKLIIAVYLGCAIEEPVYRIKRSFCISCTFFFHTKETTQIYARAHTHTHTRHIRTKSIYPART